MSKQQSLSYPVENNDSELIDSFSELHRAQQLNAQRALEERVGLPTPDCDTFEDGDYYYLQYLGPETTWQIECKALDSLAKNLLDKEYCEGKTGGFETVPSGHFGTVRGNRLICNNTERLIKLDGDGNFYVNAEYRQKLENIQPGATLILDGVSQHLYDVIGVVHATNVMETMDYSKHEEAEQEVADAQRRANEAVNEALTALHMLNDHEAQINEQIEKFQENAAQSIYNAEELVKKIEHVLSDWTYPSRSVAQVYLQSAQKSAFEALKRLLFAACILGVLELVKYIVDLLTPSAKSEQSFAKQTALMYASRYGQLRVAVYLLELEDNSELVFPETFNSKSELGASELDVNWVVSSDDANLQNLQLDDTDMAMTMLGGQTALMFASENGHVDIAQQLLDDDANIDKADEQGDTALMLACWKGHVEVAGLLLDHAADVNRANSDDFTALMWACGEGHTKAASLLLERGANVNQTNKDGETAFKIARRNDHLETAADLLFNKYKQEWGDSMCRKSMCGVSWGQLMNEIDQNIRPQFAKKIGCEDMFYEDMSDEAFRVEDEDQLLSAVSILGEKPDKLEDFTDEYRLGEINEKSIQVFFKVCKKIYDWIYNYNCP